VFSSGFREGDAHAVAASVNSSLNSEPTVNGGPSVQFDHGNPFHRRVITMEEDFDVVHNVLYYIYTNQIRFSTFESGSSEPEAVPKACDAEDIFALAHRLDLTALKKLALAFLGRTCSLENITSRVFSHFAFLYEEAGEIYDLYLKKEWPRIQKSNEFQKYFLAMEEGNNSKEIIRIFGKFRELSQKLTVK
jgi:hypothetical protein